MGGKTELHPTTMSSISGVKKGLSLLTKAEVAHLKSRSRLIFNNLPNPSILGPEKEILESKSQPSLSPFTVPEKSLSLRSGSKVLKKALFGHKLASYYPDSIHSLAKKDWPEYITEKDQIRKEKIARMYARSAPPTRKGEGKELERRKNKESY